MTITQIAIARSARQMAARVAAGEITARKDKIAAVWLFDQLARYAHELPIEEFNASGKAFEPIWAVAAQVESWRIYSVSAE